MIIRQCFLTNNDCYKANKKMKPKGIIVHSTGANNPNLKRYVQPDDGYIGKNAYNNSWNKAGVDKCVHAFIGKDKNGEVALYQTLPFDVCAWGCGKGSKGSYNYNPAYIQFEICEDGLTDKAYFDKAMALAQDLCVELMDRYPDIKLENVISHNEAYKRGYASSHKDCDHWLAKFGLDMNWFRSRVEAKAKGSEAPAPEAPKTYIVKKGDNLTKIAKANNTTYKVLANINGIKYPYIIRVGQEIKLP